MLYAFAIALTVKADAILCSRDVPVQPEPQSVKRVEYMRLGSLRAIERARCNSPGLSGTCGGAETRAMRRTIPSFWAAATTAAERAPRRCWRAGNEIETFGPRDRARSFERPPIAGEQIRSTVFKTRF
jgi:hypothetical protein